MSAAGRPLADLWMPEGPKQGARKGAKVAVDYATTFTAGLWPIFFYGAGALGVPAIGAVIGAIVGAAKGPPRSEVRQAEAVLEAALIDVAVPERLRRRLAERLQESGPEWKVVLLDADEMVEEEARRYRPFAPSGIDSMVELGATTIEVSGPWGVDPRGALILSVEARLIRISDGKVLVSRAFEHRGGAHAFSDWPDPERVRARLREELLKASLSLADQMMSELFQVPVSPAAVRKTSENVPAIPVAAEQVELVDIIVRSEPPQALLTGRLRNRSALFLTDVAIMVSFYDGRGKVGEATVGGFGDRLQNKTSGEKGISDMKVLPGEEREFVVRLEAQVPAHYTQVESQVFEAWGTPQDLPAGALEQVPVPTEGHFSGSFTSLEDR